MNASKDMAPNFGWGRYVYGDTLGMRYHPNQGTRTKKNDRETPPKISETPLSPRIPRHPGEDQVTSSPGGDFSTPPPPPSRRIRRRHLFFRGRRRGLRCGAGVAWSRGTLSATFFHCWVNGRGRCGHPFSVGGINTFSEKYTVRAEGIQEVRPLPYNRLA